MLRRLDLIRPEDQSLPNAEDQAQVQAGSQVPGRTLVDRGRVRSPIVPDENRKDLAQKRIKRLYLWAKYKSGLPASTRIWQLVNGAISLSYTAF